MTSLAASPRRIATWLPLVAIVMALAISAVSGRGAFAGDADAASNTIDVTGLVTKIVYLDASACSAASALDIGDIVPNDPWKQTTSNCSITFGSSNSALGADLTIDEDPAAPAAPAGAMKCAAPTCTGGSFDGQLNDVAPNSAPPAGSTSAFGVQLQSATLLATSSWTVGNAYPVAATATACSTGAIGDGVCAFRFGASADVNDGPGVYQAQTRFVVLAR